MRELRSGYNLNRLLKYFNMGRSTFYENLKPQKDKYKEIKSEILDIYYKSNRRKGYRWITSDLKKLGYNINHKTVLRLMQRLGIKSVVRAKKYSSFTGSVSGTAVENILGRDFSTTEINQKWTTDVTEFKVCGKRVYLSGIMDMHSKELIAHTVGFSPNMKLIMRMIKLAYRKTGNPKNVIIQSDQGWQYRHVSYKHFLKKKNAVQSMSRKGNCLDNAVIENFWGILKTEWFYLNDFDSVDTFLEQLEDYIHYFNYERDSSVLNYRTPVEVRTKKMVA
ncbi:IS3 family transposase [Treponema berlinense]|uniref:IS3 family transposase n=1 Tax=Treponema berlinense TaxID=225004 RepID=UPI003F09603F